MGPRSHTKINTKPTNNTLLTLQNNIQTQTIPASPFSVVIYIVILNDILILLFLNNLKIF